MNTNEVTEQEPEPESDLVHVINRAGHIENLFNQIISDYCAPREHAKNFMWRVVLDTSIMPLHSKLKVVMAIANELNYSLPKDPLNKVIQYRNAFAHNTTDAHPIISFGVDPADTKAYNIFWTIDGSGRLKEEKRHEAFEKFKQHCRTSRDALVELKKKVREQIEAHSQWAAVPKPKSGK